MISQRFIDELIELKRLRMNDKTPSSRLILKTGVNSDWSFDPSYDGLGEIFFHKTNRVINHSEGPSMVSVDYYYRVRSVQFHINGHKKDGLYEASFLSPVKIEELNNALFVLPFSFSANYSQLKFDMLNNNIRTFQHSKNGNAHREDGPAIASIKDNVFKQYFYLNGKELDKEDFIKILERKEIQSKLQKL